MVAIGDPVSPKTSRYLMVMRKHYPEVQLFDEVYDYYSDFNEAAQDMYGMAEKSEVHSHLFDMNEAKEIRCAFPCIVATSEGVWHGDVPAVYDYTGPVIQYVTTPKPDHSRPYTYPSS